MGCLERETGEDSDQTQDADTLGVDIRSRWIFSSRDEHTWQQVSRLSLDPGSRAVGWIRQPSGFMSPPWIGRDGGGQVSFYDQVGEAWEVHAPLGAWLEESVLLGGG